MRPAKGARGAVLKAKNCSHAELCERAVRWLSGSRRCNVVLSGIASTREIPDAIGWSTSREFYGSIVVECKSSLSDFRRDHLKPHERRMGTRRYFFTPWDLVSAVAVEQHHPDHGLLHLFRGRVVVVREAPVRPDPALCSEIRLLQFAIVHMRSNLLSMGMTVDLDLLTLHPFTLRRRDKAESLSREALRAEEQKNLAKLLEGA
jgi:hypothetical protein